MPEQDLLRGLRPFSGCELQRVGGDRDGGDHGACQVPGSSRSRSMRWTGPELAVWLDRVVAQ